MILSKSSLKVSDISAVDKDIPVLNNVHITSDGSLIAANSKSVIAVSPVSKDVKTKVPINESNHHKRATISTETIKEVIKNIPRDTLFQGLLEYCDFNDGSFELTDGKRKKKIEGNVYQRDFIKFRGIYKEVDSEKRKHRIVLNRKRLIKLLQVIDAICPDTSGESAVYIDFTDNNSMVLRAVNHKTRQRCIGIMHSYKGIEGNWLNPDLWEKKLCQKKKAIKKKSVAGIK